jgi:hypothetical protein
VEWWLITEVKCFITLGPGDCKYQRKFSSSLVESLLPVLPSSYCCQSQRNSASYGKGIIQYGCWVSPILLIDKAGPGSAGAGSAGPGSAGPGSAGPDSAGPGLAGPDSAGPGPVGTDLAGPGSAGPGLAGSGLAGPGSAGPGSAGPGSAGPG